MEKINNNLKSYQKINIDDLLKKTYASALKNNDFKKLITRIKAKDEVAYRYTSKLERTIEELNNCSGCKGLAFCKNKVCGFVYYPKLVDKILEFNYIACKYQKKVIEQTENIKTSFFSMPYEIKIARMKDIDITDKKRIKIIKWLKEFYDSYKLDNHQKGLFLHGSFGSGKTYLISALLNELSAQKYSSVVIYYPELLRNLKESFEENDFKQRMDEILNADLLLLDDLGAETVTGWNRDEILGTILQHRMDNKLPLFITSNLNKKEMELHFVINKNSAEDIIKARRIIERINQMTDDFELISENKRK